MSEPSTPLVTLYLFRHGETAWSLSGQHTSRTEIPLTEHGEAQARALGERLRPIVFDHVFTSPRQRAQRTYALTNLPFPASIDDDLREWDYGDYEGKTSAEIARRRPHWNLWKDGCPNGEDAETVANRCDRLLQRLRGLGGTIALFSHGHICCAIATRWIGAPIASGEHLVLDPATTSILGYSDHHADTAAIRRWNAP